MSDQEARRAGDEVFLRGKRVTLRPLRPSDADGPYAGWFNDPEVHRHNSHGTFPFLREQALAYIERVRTSRVDLVLAAETVENPRHVGNITLQHIHSVYRSAEFAVVFGDRSVKGTGIGFDAAVLLLRHGFDALGLHRVACGTIESNASMQKLAQRLGMREEGRRRQAMWKHGRFFDVIEYGVLAQEFHAATSNVDV